MGYLNPRGSNHGDEVFLIVVFIVFFTVAFSIGHYFSSHSIPKQDTIVTVPQ